MAAGSASNGVSAMTNNIIQDFLGIEDLAHAEKRGEDDARSGREAIPQRAVSLRRTILSGPGRTANEEEIYLNRYNAMKNSENLTSKMAEIIRADGPSFSAPSSSNSKNSFAHRIKAAENLYEGIVRIGHVIDSTEKDLRTIFMHHDLLIAEYFEDLLQNNIKPRVIDLRALKQEIVQHDARAVAALVEKYQQAIRGKEQGKQIAEEFFSNVNLAALAHLDRVAIDQGSGNPRDYDTQIAVAWSIKGMFEALLVQIDMTGRAYDACVHEHGELMEQDFSAFVRNNVEPRLHTLTGIWRAVSDTDITAIDDIIARLKAVSI